MSDKDGLNITRHPWLDEQRLTVSQIRLNLFRNLGIQVDYVVNVSYRSLFPLPGIDAFHFLF
jgi:hypothetical protein